MKLKGLIINRKFKILLIVFFLLISVYIILRLFIIKSDPLFPFLISVYNFYLHIIEVFANIIFKITGTNVIIKDHQILFGYFNDYVKANEDIIQNWPGYILFKKWSLIILFLFWAFPVIIQKKMIYTGFFLLTHFISVLSGLLIICVIGPAIVNIDTLKLLPAYYEQLEPGIIGEVAMTTLLVIWMKNNMSIIKKTLGKFKVNVQISDRKINELIVLFYFFIILKNFIVPFFNFTPYIGFLFKLTKGLVVFLGYNAVINGTYLIGDGGTIFMAKWCLGFVTMFIFAALVYLTGKKNKEKWIFIVSGIILLHILNIIRLAALFIFLQKNGNVGLTHDHHDLYNVIVYIIIFILWVVFFEKYAGIKKVKIKNIDQ